MDGTLIANKDLVYRSYTYPNDTFHMIDKSRILGLGGGATGWLKNGTIFVRVNFIKY